jgi:hypothetical protein
MPAATGRWKVLAAERKREGDGDPSDDRGAATLCTWW